MWGNTPLHWAAQKGQVEVVRALLAAGADVGAKDQHGNTSLHEAAANGRVEAVRALVAAGADVGTKDEYGKTPLDVARTDTVRKALSASPPQQPPPRQAGVSRAEVHARDANTQLLDAARCGQAATVQDLVHSGAQLSYVDEDGDTALHLAARANHARVVEVLVWEEMDLDVKGSGGYSALCRAAESGGLAAATLLLDAKADVSQRTDEGQTPLHIAAWNGHVALVELLLGRGADINLQNREGRTALHHAVQRSQQQVVQALLRGGADVTVVDQRGEEALHVAAGNNDETLVAELLRYGGDADARTKDGCTPVHKAAAACALEAINLLLASGANPTLATNSFEMPSNVVATACDTPDPVRTHRVREALYKATQQQQQLVAEFARYDVFISHAGEQKEDLAEPLQLALGGHGYRVFLDKNSLLPSQRNDEHIIAACKMTSVGVLILSKEFVRKTWPMKELRILLRRWLRRDVQLLPVLCTHGIKFAHLEDMLEHYRTKPWRVKDDKPPIGILKCWTADLKALTSCTMIVQQQGQDYDQLIKRVVEAAVRLCRS